MSALKICPQCGSEYELDQSFCPKDGSTLKSQSATGDLVGTIIADRYRVTKKLGEGGMGTVYLAEHVKMGRKSAVKVMNPGMVNDADAISRFNREAANASRINHANVAAVYDFGETKEGLIYLAMEFVEGPSLTSVIEKSGSLSPSRAAEIARQAGEALAVAHDMGIVHRDLKPDNIMLAKGRDGADIVKIVDFGIAKAAEAENQKVTKTGLVVGTPEYMSPEQLAGDKLDGRSDTYSLALVAYAMLTGKLPFPADTAQESMIKRLTDAPLPLVAMKGDVSWPAEVQAVMDKALEREAANRYQTAAEFGRALHQAVSAMPIEVGAHAATAVMSAPAAAAAPAGGGKTVPQTRVNPRTPNAPTPAVAPPAPAARSKMPMIAVAAVIVLGLGGFGAWKAMGRAPAAEPLSNPNLPAATPSGNPAPAGPTKTPAQILAEALPIIDSLTDLNKGATVGTANASMTRLDSLAPLAENVTDSARIALFRASVHFVLSDKASDLTTKNREMNVGCTILRDNEGKIDRSTNTGLKRRMRFYLYGDESAGIPKVCP